ncbi:unnamed protein product [Lactuca virosa]|uniref:Uncharacterized protein n=1 Tax=Lactuca virosa TaxID=75947 RepID=A0AAU9LLW9_9ASTR|nr:unnamed protein product [Lactuca virosa]
MEKLDQHPIDVRSVLPVLAVMKHAPLTRSCGNSHSIFAFLHHHLIYFSEEDGGTTSTSPTSTVSLTSITHRRPPSKPSKSSAPSDSSSSKHDFKRFSPFPSVPSTTSHPTHHHPLPPPPSPTSARVHHLTIISVYHGHHYDQRWNSISGNHNGIRLQAHRCLYFVLILRINSTTSLLHQSYPRSLKLFKLHTSDFFEDILSQI